MIRLNSTMLIAKGQSPTPAISPICVLVRLNSLPHWGSVSALKMNPNDVVLNATKQARKSFLSDCVSVLVISFWFCGCELLEVIDSVFISDHNIQPTVFIHVMDNKLNTYSGRVIDQVLYPHWLVLTVF